MKQLLEEKGLMALPVGFHRVSEEMVRLEEVFDDLDSLQSQDTLRPAQRRELALKRWQAGSWQDLYACEELITLDRAEKAVRSNTRFGRILIGIELRAIAMMLEDIARKSAS